MKSAEAQQEALPSHNYVHIKSSHLRCSLEFTHCMVGEDIRGSDNIHVFYRGFDRLVSFSI